jgi:hypothetical protein
MLRCRNNIKIDFQEVVCEGMDWIHLAQVRGQKRALVNTAMNIEAAQKGRTFLTS